ncbi:hypothetical protein [Rubrobacter naiadicus]|uniref:hypothetical protein n=1 Tax=Rubrobacter naiadicus TaxID=1392641 RepID=UPI002362DE1E|nr:hypothetical protein [Rubrobacter naiadicus]
MDKDQLIRRLRALERRRQTYRIPPVKEAIHKELRNAQARWRGEEEEPWTSEELEARAEASRWVLGSVIPKYRNESGWRGEEAQRLLSKWVEEVKERVEEYERSAHDAQG